jgi:transcription elongation factor Elf1
MVELTWLEENNNVLTTFGCLICGDQTLSRPQMSIHVGGHNPANNKPAKRKYTKRGNTKVEAVNTVSKMIDDLTAERDHYKQLARKYQRQLQALRDVFKVEDVL